MEACVTKKCTRYDMTLISVRDVPVSLVHFGDVHAVDGCCLLAQPGHLSGGRGVGGIVHTNTLH